MAIVNQKSVLFQFVIHLKQELKKARGINKKTALQQNLQIGFNSDNSVKPWFEVSDLKVEKISTHKDSITQPS